MKCIWKNNLPLRILPGYITKRIGKTFGKFGSGGRSGVDGVGIGMPGASGTGIVPQKASMQLHNTIPAKNKVSNIKGTLSLKKTNRIINV